MQHRRASVDRATILQEVEACTHTQATDQGIEVFLSNAFAVRARELVTHDATVCQFSLRFDKGNILQTEVPTVFSTHAKCIVVIVAAHVAQRKVAREARVLSDQVNELTVFTEPGTIIARP